MKIIFLAILSGMLLMTSSAKASVPVESTLTGCVFDNKFYSVRADKAYPIHLSPELNLVLYEGKTVRIQGRLYPGDRFSIFEGMSPEVIRNTCEAGYRKAINRLYIIQFRIAALKAAKKGDFSEAFMFINNALNMDKTDCDTYIDRAQIYCMKEDFVSASRDISVIKTGACANHKKANYLMLQDLGRILESKGRKQEALEVYKIALDTCESHGKICMETIQKDIQNLLSR